MELSEFVVPKECYPRLAYASRNIPSLETRCNEIKEKLGIHSSEVEGRHLSIVYVYLIKKQSEAELLLPEEIVLKSSKKVKTTQSLQYKTLKALLEHNKTFENYISIVITSSGMKDKLSKLDKCGHYVVHIASDAKEARMLGKAFQCRFAGPEIVFSSKKLLANDINNMLEEIAYQPLKPIFVFLQQMLQTESSEPEPVGKKRCESHYHTHAKLSTTDKEMIECMCEEILALYEVSNVPEQLRPKDFQDTQLLITKEMIDDIFTQCSIVKAVGFHFNNLHIYVEDATEHEKKNMLGREEEIRAVMQKHNIGEYCITVSGQFTELMDIGSPIEAHGEHEMSKKGSLGCYADMNDGRTCNTSILLSRHVADGCREIYIAQNEKKQMIATVMQATTEHEHGSLDIAAAEVKDGIIIEEDARKLKDSEGNLRQGMLCENSGSDTIFRKGRKVHIWGSKSKPGHGIITDTKYFVNGMQESLIQIQDDFGDRERRFATEGDSGSIVCSDDPNDEHVKALAMLIGQIDQRHACNVDIKRTYLSLPLREGVEQLERKTRKKFALFE